MGPNYTDTRSRHYRPANSRDEECRAYKSRPVDCTVSILFVATVPCRNEASLHRGSCETIILFHPVVIPLPVDHLFFFFLVLSLSLSRGRTTMVYERCERLALNERNRKDAEEEEERRPRERAVSLRRQKVRLITGRPQVLVKPWQRQLSAPKATHGFTEVYARRGLFAPEKTRVGRRSVG